MRWAYPEEVCFDKGSTLPSWCVDTPPLHWETGLQLLAEILFLVVLFWTTRKLKRIYLRRKERLLAEEKAALGRSSTTQGP